MTATEEPNPGTPAPGPAIDNAGPVDDASVDTLSEHSAHSMELKKKGSEVTDAVAPPTDWGYLPSLNIRINRLHSFSDKADRIYHISHVPSDVKWTRQVHSDRDNSEMLCPADSRFPATVWFVGKITRFYFFESSGEAPPSVSINIAPLDPLFLKAANNLLRRFSMPRNSPSFKPYDDVRVSCGMSIRRVGEAAKTNEPFVNIFDATKLLRSPRTSMESIPATDLKKNTLALVEAHVSRYHGKTTKPNESSSFSSPTKTNFAEWTAYYHLKCVNILDDTPSTEPDTLTQASRWSI